MPSTRSAASLARRTITKAARRIRDEIDRLVYAFSASVAASPLFTTNFAMKCALPRIRSRLKSIIDRDTACFRFDLDQAVYFRIDLDQTVHFRIDLDQSQNWHTMKHYFQEIRSRTGRDGVRFRGAPRLIGRGTGGCPVVVQINVRRFDRYKGTCHRIAPGEDSCGSRPRGDAAEAEE